MSVTEQEPFDLVNSLQSNKEGYWYTTKADLLFYQQEYFICIAFFFGMYYFWKFLFERQLMPFQSFRKRWDNRKTDEDKAYFLSTWTANTHHIIIYVTVYLSFKYPQCDDPSPWKFFTDDLCFITVDTNQVKIGIFTASYLTYDYIIQKFYVKGEDEVSKQMLWHHILGVSGVLIGNIGGYALCNIIALLLLVEVSTVFLNYRSMYTKDEIGEPVPQLLQVLFFIFYTVFRMMLLPYGLYLILKNWELVGHHLSTTRQVFWGLSLLEFVVLYLMNVYWYILILRGLLKMLGCIKKSDSYVKIEEGDGPKENNNYEC